MIWKILPVFAINTGKDWYFKHRKYQNLRMNNKVRGGLWPCELRSWSWSWSDKFGLVYVNVIFTEYFYFQSSLF